VLHSEYQYTLKASNLISLDMRLLETEYKKVLKHDGYEDNYTAMFPVLVI